MRQPRPTAVDRALQGPPPNLRPPPHPPLQIAHEVYREQVHTGGARAKHLPRRPAICHKAKRQ
eukprot:2266575-Pyramimonas_sp.AAC.1